MEINLHSITLINNDYNVGTFSSRGENKPDTVLLAENVHKNSFKNKRFIFEPNYFFYEYTNDKIIIRSFSFSFNSLNKLSLKNVINENLKWFEDKVGEIFAVYIHDNVQQFTITNIQRYSNLYMDGLFTFSSGLVFPGYWISLSDNLFNFFSYNNKYVEIKNE